MIVSLSHFDFFSRYNYFETNFVTKSGFIIFAKVTYKISIMPANSKPATGG
jgi:hypothetical protein